MTISTTAFAWQISQYIDAHQEALLFLIAKDNQTAERLGQEIRAFLGQQDYPIDYFPDYETLPYDHFSPSDDIISARIAILAKLHTRKKGLLISAVPTVMHRLAPPSYIRQHSFTMQKNDQLDREGFREQLIQNGYRLVSEVMAHGEFSVRGSIIDVFPMGATSPYRIDLFDNDIDSLRTFDPETQLSETTVDAIELYPAHEYPLDTNGVQHFRQAWRDRFSGNPSSSSLYQSVSQGQSAAGIEYYLPFFFDKLGSIFDYLPGDTNIIFYAMEDNPQKFWADVKNRYEQYQGDLQRPILPPEEIFLLPQQLGEYANRFKKLLLNSDKDEKAFTSVPVHDLKSFENFMKNFEGRVVVCAESLGRKEALKQILHDLALDLKSYESVADFQQDTHRHGLVIGPWQEGFVLSDPAMALVTETEIFGQVVITKRQQKSKQRDPNTLIYHLMELQVGAPIVHIDHGVGRYLGLKKLLLNEQENEFLVLKYGDESTLYVPVTSLHLISRYTGGDPERAPLHKLGTDQWQKAKRKAAEQIRDVAAELLVLYAKREATPGFAFSEPDQDYYRFAAAFPFVETDDQRQSIEAIIEDMKKPQPMDRLVCGDVGFGKTEVAMRAAFLAANQHKQVAIFVPTTLLAEQHFQNFSDRFADWPIRVALLSRFKSAVEKNAAIKGLAEGSIDIIIGTHQLLNPKIKFKNLGLLVIDEEHRFGVQQKEKIKALASDIDILTLTATPIPRTLNLAFSGLRGLSLITTPPQRRLSTKTFVHEYRENIIHEAISREVMRGGQVYFIHNNVESIAHRAQTLQNLLPESKVAFAHGQMPGHELERIMRDFYHQRFNVLVCTTIVESGIDIPTANTLIIERADHFGLAQLHQLRGRVGRSHHQAYAYFLTPPWAALTPDAKKRLEAIASIDSLGAGFALANHDLEIRGAGELLGEEQSGHIESIGFSLYMELLEKAMKSLKKGEALDWDNNLDAGLEIDLQVPALLPDAYVPDVHTRLLLYKRMAQAKTQEDLREIRSELIDRFGLIPPQSENLFAITAIKLEAEKLGIQKIEANANGGRFTFNKKPAVDPMKIITLIQKQSHRYRLDPSQQLCFSIKTDDFAARIQCVKDILALLS
jgi:transcription-repair coupling factor (superfamily II helicase)